MPKELYYRAIVKEDDLINYDVVFKETDLFIKTKKDLRDTAMRAVLKYRKDIEDYIAGDPLFKTSMSPYKIKDGAPEIVKKMAYAAEIAGVGPMASVAGAIAEFVGENLSQFSEEVIVENGGDIYIRGFKERKVAIYSGDSPFSCRIGLKIHPGGRALGICTSSGTVGHSFSFGKADAAVILSESATVSDAVATATGNLIKTEEDIEKGIDFARKTPEILGVVIIKGKRMGLWGELEAEKI